MAIGSPSDHAFRDISLRGRIAFSVACLEELGRHLDLDGVGFDDLVERLWRPVVAPPGMWRTAEIPRTFAEVSALFSPAPDDAALELVRSALEALWNIRECAMDPSPRTRDRTEEFLSGLTELLAKAGAAIPEPAYFLERAARSAQGFGDIGRAAPPAYYRETIAWEELEPSLRRGLCSVSVHRRREAAFALIHLGLPSRGIERVLARTAHDLDPDVRALSLQAWRRLFTDPLDSPFPPVYFHDVPDFRGYLHRRLARWSRANVAPHPHVEDLDSPREDERRRAIEHAGRVLGDSEALRVRLDELLRRDFNPAIRRLAAVWISEAPFTDARLANLVSAIHDEEDILARAAKLFAIGTFGPRAASAVPAILATLSRVQHPAYDASAYYAAEALEAIGAAGFEAILGAISSGNQQRTEWWLRSLALRPDLRDALMDELARRNSSDEPWLQTRYQRALGILRSSDR